MANTKAVDLQRWTAALATGNPDRIAAMSRQLAREGAKVDTDYRFTLTDQLWRAQGSFASDLMEGSGTDPRNDVPTGSLVLKGNSDWVDVFAACERTMVGVIVETADLRFPFYVKKHTEKFEKGALTHQISMRGIWDILNYYVIWPTWWLPLQAQPISHAVFFWALQTCLESMVAECALRLQSGIWEFVNNALSLNPDMRAWFGTLLQNNANMFHSLQTPTYVKRTNPFTDTSPLYAKTVRMETCGTVIKDATRAYGVDTAMDLWLPGDAQPDPWANLTQPTYVFSTKDRSQITGPTGTVLDSVIRTVVDLEGSIMGRALDPILNPKGQNPALPRGAFEATRVGVNFEAPYAIVIAPEPGEDSAVVSYEINHHTPDGWQHIIGGRSPKWLNDLFNATFAWLIDSLMIIVGFAGVPSDLLSGFMNNAFFAFQMCQSYQQRAEMGPYHPAIERFYPTASSPYNIETVFAFINALFDARGYTAAQVTINLAGPEVQYALGRDIFKGGLMSLVYRRRTKMITDYIENIMWRITPTERTLTAQIGDGRKDEAPLAKHQRWITGTLEAVAVLTLSPQSS